MKKTVLFIPLFAVLATVGLGCSSAEQAQTNEKSATNEAVAENTNVQEEDTNINDEVVNQEPESDTNESQGGTTDEEEVDTSDWNTFTFDHINISILLPFKESEIENGYTECSINSGCDSDGYSYTVTSTKGDNYVVLSSVSEIWNPSREGLITDFHNFDVNNNIITINPHLESSWAAPIITEVNLKSGQKAYLFDPIKSYYGQSELYNIDDFAPTYAAVIPLPSNSNFKSVFMYVEQNDMSLDELKYSLENIEFINIQGQQSTNDPLGETNQNGITEEEIDTSDWVSYTNDEHGFSFRYPEKYNSISEKNSNEGIRYFFHDDSKENTDVTDGFGLIIIESENQGLNAWLEEKGQNDSSYQGEKTILQNEETLKIFIDRNGYPTTDEDGMPIYEHQRMLIQNGKTILSFDIPNTEIAKYFDSIMQTISFE